MGHDYRMEDGHPKKDNRARRRSAAIPADLRPRMDATSMIKYVTPHWSLQSKPPAALAEQAVSNTRMNHPLSPKIDEA